MKVEVTPTFKFTNDEVQEAIYFHALCNAIDKAIVTDCLDGADVVQTIIEKNIMMDWDKFFETVQHLTLFIRGHQED